MVMFKKISKAFVICLAVCLSACNNYEFPESPYATVTPVTVVVTPDGVSLEARPITHGDLSVLSHGFVWGTSENLSLVVDDHVNMGAMPEPGPYKYTITEGLQAKTTYYVMAYVSDGKHLTYGRVNQFRK